jgi:hypothetical protein
MQGIQRRHEVHIGSTRKGQQNLGQQLGKGFNYSVASSMGTASLTRNTLPLTWASMPPLALYMRKLPPHRATLSSLRVPVAKGARVTPPGRVASSPSWCISFIAGRPIRLYD